LTFDGVIELAGEEIVEGRLRRYYELTPEGTTMLADESKRRVKVSNIALRRLRFVGGFA